MYEAKSLHIIFDNIDRYIRKYNGTKSLTLFDSDAKYERCFDRVSYLIMLKNIYSRVYFQKFVKTKINSDNNLPLEKTLNIQNVVILVNSVFSKNQNYYFYQVFLKTCSDNVKMLYFNRIDASKDIDSNKASIIDCIIWHY